MPRLHWPRLLRRGRVRPDALVGWTIAAVVGVAFVGPELGRIDEAARAHGRDSPEVAMRVKRLFMTFRFDTVLLPNGRLDDPVAALAASGCRTCR